MFTQIENLGLESKLKYLHVVKNFRKEVFIGSRWSNSSPKSEDWAEIAKNCVLRQSWSYILLGNFTNFNGFLSPQSNL